MLVVKIFKSIQVC